jgi:putative phage-type endonuclease
MLTPQQIAERTEGLFATDAAPALNLSKYKTPVQLWLEKTKQAEQADLSAVEAVQMGNYMEPVIARLYEERMGIPLMQLPLTLWHDEHKFMGSHFDYVARGERRLVEIKNFNAMRRKEFGENGSGDVPMDVLVQCIHEATVFKTDRIDVAVLFGGQEFCVFPLTVDPAASKKLIEMEEEFWRKHVVERTPPEPRTTEETRALFKRDNGSTIIASHEVQSAVARLKQIKQGIEELSKVEDALKAQVQAYMESYSTLQGQDGSILATWKASKDSTKFDMDTFKAEHPNIHGRYLKDVPGSRRFLVK